MDEESSNKLEMGHLQLPDQIWKMNTATRRKMKNINKILQNRGEDQQRQAGNNMEDFNGNIPKA